MLKFKRITIEDKSLFDKYLKPYPFLSSEYSFANLYIWRDNYETEYCIHDQVLIIRKKDSKGRYSFLEPLGYTEDNVREIINLMVEYCKQCNEEVLFREVTEEFAKKLPYYTDEKLEIIEDRDNFDYIYDSLSLSTLEGKKYQKKRNHYKSFANSYQYRLIDLRKENITPRLMETVLNWYGNKEQLDKRIIHELKGIRELADNMEYLDLEGVAVEVDDKIVSFSIGERVSPKVAIIHIEKGDINYKGVYSFINKSFVENYFSDVEYINREQDLGIEGLRKAKLSYYPAFLEKKYRIKSLN